MELAAVEKQVDSLKNDRKIEYIIRVIFLSPSLHNLRRC